MTRLHPARWPALPVLVVAWSAYVAFLVFAFPATPLAVLAMVAPLLLSGWYARNAIVTAVVGLTHGAALAGVGWWVGAFESWPGGAAGLALVGALLMLLSWFTAVAGQTVRVMQLLRHRTSELQTARLEMDADRASVEAIYEASAAALIAISGDGTIRSWNLGARQIFGIQPNQILGLDIQRLAASGDPEDCMGRIRYAMQAHHTLDTIQARMCHAEGHVLDVEVRGQPVVHPDGDAGFILTIVDRTRERRMERELRTQAALQDRMLQNLDDVIYSVEVPSKDILLVTRNITKLAGHDANEITSFDTILDLAHPDDREEVAKRWEHARAGEQSTLRWRIRCDDGSHMWVEDHAVPARNDEGRVVRVDGIMRRIGRDLELERQAQRMMRWLDAMEPMTGGGAWSLDLRDGSWRWSAGMHRILGTEPSQESLGALCDRLHERSAARLQRLLDQPVDMPGRLRIQVSQGDQHAPFVMESWMQRGADGEPIWMYGIIRPLQAATPTMALPPAQKAPAAQAPAKAAKSGIVQELEPARPRPNEQERILDALQRSQAVVEAARMAAPPFPPTGWSRHENVHELGVDVCDAITQAITQDLESASLWARHRIVPLQSHHSVFEPIGEAVREWSHETVQDLCNAIAAAEQHALEAASKQALMQAQETKEAALAEAERVKQTALEAAKEAHHKAMQEVAKAQEAAATQSRRAHQADAARQQAEDAQAKAENEKVQALREAEATRAEALKQVKLARAEALREADNARAEAEREALRAKEAEAARAEADAARTRALEEAEQAKSMARKEAGQARAEALKHAEEARKRADAIAAEATKAQRLRDEAEQAKLAAMQSAKQTQERAIREAEEAKAQVLQEAEQTTTRVLEQARRAEAVAKQEAAKARAAQEARIEAEKAAKAATIAGQEALARALAEAEQTRKQALAEADAAREAALEEARRATAAALAQAEQARMESIQAAKRAQEAIQEEQAKARHAEQAMARAVQEAEAKASALAEAEQARAAALAQAREAQTARDAAMLEAQEAQQRFVDAEAKAEAELESLRARTPGAMPVPSFAPVPTGKLAMPEEEVDMEVVWDDEVGWVPRAKSKGGDKASEIKAKSWNESKGGAKSGPWALD